MSVNPIFENDSSSQTSPSLERFEKKKLSLNIPDPNSVSLKNWNLSRVFTPGDSFGYLTPMGLEFANGEVQLFKSIHDSQGLIKENEKVVAASVSTHIKTTTKRTSENKSTHIQYDKTRVKQGKDFSVISTNSKGKTNYEGGHLIDHKFSAKDSHTTEENYIPELRMYNSPIKEYLVNRSDAYVEIPLYTFNSATIGVMKSKKSHLIPVGIIFVQINKDKIEDVYYFPNNNVDYEGLKKKLHLTKDIAKNLIPYFKLKRSLHIFFQCALITDMKNYANGKSIQSAIEEKFFALMEHVSLGMSLVECDNDAEEISAVAFAVLNEEEMDPRLFLDCTQNQWNTIKDQPLQPPFKALGEFIIKYGLKNCLKTEVLSIESRLVFASLIIDFIDHREEIKQKAMDFIEDLAEEFESTLDELDQIKKNMNQEELFFYANLYQRLSSVFNHDLINENLAVYFKEPFEFFYQFIDILKYISKKYPIAELQGDFASQFLTFVEDAQGALENLKGFPLENQIKILKSFREPCLKLVKRHSMIGHFQSNINHVTAVRASEGYLEAMMGQLGLVDDDSDSSESE
ncbi:MAG: hypothetical protein L0207_06705 [Chlamydiae bacterium]|nr:hypothetical protein [Chlamydiota bacterium]